MNSTKLSQGPHDSTTNGNSTKSSKGPHHSTTNGYAQPDMQNDSSKLAISKKVYIHRNSILTDLTKVNHIRSLYNLFHVVIIAVFLNMTLLYLAEPSKFWNDISIMKWATSKFSYFVMFWLLFNLFAFAFYEGFKLWIAVRNKINSKTADRLFLLLFIATFALTFAVTGYYMHKVNLPLICGMAAGCEQVRIYMKIYSFVRENIPRVMQYKPQKDGNQQHTLYPTRKHYLYYFFAPVLIYRDSYPRSENRQWRNVFHNLYFFSLCFFFFYSIFMRFNIDIYKNVGIQPITKKEIALVMAASMVTGFTVMFMTFIGLLHCWQNIFAELLGFGDREFYKDWWNSTAFSKYYRKWNILVHDWLYAYIYTEFQKLGCSSSFSTILVFVTSAIFHEYVMFITFGYFYPVLFMIYTTTTLHVFFTRNKTSQFWNTFMWCNFVLGNAMVTAFCSIEWYARINCPTEERNLNSYISTPRFLDPSCQIINFS